MKLGYLNPKNQILEKKQLCLELEQKLRNLMETKLTLAKQKLAIRIERMKALSPLAKLNQGFAYVTNEQGCAVKNIEQVHEEEHLSIYVTDGIVRARVVNTVKEEYDV